MKKEIRRINVTKKGLIKLLIIITGALIVISFMLRMVSGFDIYKQNNFDQNAWAEIHHPDGSIEYYNSISFPVVNKGDVVFIKVDLPQDRYIKNSSICFYVYHSVISVYDASNNLLYTYGEERAAEEKMIGKVFVSADIPDECWGKSLTIRLDVQENNAYSRIDDIMIIKSSDFYKYLIAGQEIELFFFITILTASSLITLVLLLLGKWNSIKKQGIFLSSFLVLVSLWVLQYNGMLNIFTDNKILCGDLEYIALFYSPILLSLFFYEQVKDKKIKKIQLTLVFIIGIIDVVFTVLNYTTSYHYSNMVSLFHIILVLGVFIDLIIIINHDRNNKLSNVVIKYGALISLIIVLFELMRYYIYKYTNRDTLPLGGSLTAIAVGIFIISIILSYAMQLADHYISEYEKRNLEKLAYYDILTGISNRTGCYRFFENLDYSKENAVAFIDLNDLKYANDEFGHETGDELIKFVGNALKITFKDKGFYGRLGGDEFVVAICNHKNNEIYDYMNDLNKIFDQANEEKLFPVKVSISYGISISNKENPIYGFELIEEADEKMYENKRKYKKQNKSIKKLCK